MGEEHQQREALLREREAQCRSIFEATTDALIIGDLDGFVVEVNPAACTTYGYPHDEFVGVHVSTFQLGDTRSWII